MTQRNLKILISVLALILAAMLVLLLLLSRQEKDSLPSGETTQAQDAIGTDATDTAPATGNSSETKPPETEGDQQGIVAPPDAPKETAPAGTPDVPVEGLDSAQSTTAPAEEPETPTASPATEPETPSTAPAQEQEDPTEETAETTMPPNMLPIG